MVSPNHLGGSLHWKAPCRHAESPHKAGLGAQPDWWGMSRAGTSQNENAVRYADRGGGRNYPITRASQLRRPVKKGPLGIPGEHCRD